MGGFLVRLITVEDVPQLLELSRRCAEEWQHPAATYPRDEAQVKLDLFGKASVDRVFVAEKGDRLLGFATWRSTYDFLFCQKGGEISFLYVSPEARCRGIAAALLTQICADIRNQGGCFAWASYNPEQMTTARLYNRVVISSPNPHISCHLSARAFEAMADLAGKSPRYIARNLPDKALNYSPK